MGFFHNLKWLFIKSWLNMLIIKFQLVRFFIRQNACEADSLPDRIRVRLIPYQTEFVLDWFPTRQNSC